MNVIVTCEHGGNKIPRKYLSLFRNKKKILNSHRGWDQGALILAKTISRDLSAPLIYSNISRLLIDLNRSLHHPDLFSEFSKPSSRLIKQELIDSIYIPYRSKVINKIKESKYRCPLTAHLSIHSFTPNLNGEQRTADIGLLYDPSRKSEKLICKKLQISLKENIPELNIRCNYPYRGNADGFTTYLRSQFNERNYTGIEIEINQKHITSNNNVWLTIKQKLGKLILNNLLN